MRDYSIPQYGREGDNLKPFKRLSGAGGSFDDSGFGGLEEGEGNSSILKKQRLMEIEDTGCNWNRM